MKKIMFIAIMGMLGVVVASTITEAQPSSIPHHKQAFSLDSGTYGIHSERGVVPFVEYVDGDYPNSQEDGSIFAPYETVTQGVNNTPTNGILSIVAGEYGESLTINSAMTIEAPVGKVIIGGAGSSKIVDSDTKGTSTNEEVSDSFKLFENFPNPFNPVTVIKYTIPEKMKVQLEIFDVLGRKVTTLVNELHEAGTYQKKWDASDVAGGFYIYRLKAGKFVKSNKMVLIK